MTLVIMAAGMGNRYGGLKQIDPLGPNGEFIIDYSIYDAVMAGCDRVVFIIKEENYDIFRETVGKRVESRIKVEYAFQRMDDLPTGTPPDGRVKPWGTTQAVLACRDIVKDSFMVINADDFYGREAFAVIYDYLSELEKTKNTSGAKRIYCMPGYILKNTLSDNGHVSRGICRVDKNGSLTSIVERKKIMRNNGFTQYCDKNGSWHDIDEESVASMNFFGFDPSVFGLLEAGFKNFLNSEDTDLVTGEYLLAPALGEAIAAGECEVRVIPTDAKWFGVTYQADRALAKEFINNLIKRGVYPEKLWGKTATDRAGAYTV
ncbi:MAG: sugar phosphate nucleotidyltransferase [Eubacteriales bacterium]|nr:sugar phosphate nucleotidyltransferase [Eubacteriales bacterium]